MLHLMQAVKDSRYVSCSVHQDRSTAFSIPMATGAALFIMLAFSATYRLPQTAQGAISTELIPGGPPWRSPAVL